MKLYKKCRRGQRATTLPWRRRPWPWRRASTVIFFSFASRVVRITGHGLHSYNTSKTMRIILPWVRIKDHSLHMDQTTKKLVPAAGVSLHRTRRRHSPIAGQTTGPSGPLAARRVRARPAGAAQGARDATPTKLRFAV